MLYRIDGRACYNRVREHVPLGGNNGPLVRHMLGTCPDCGGWHLPERELLRLLGVEEEAEHAVVIDLKPKKEGNVSVYRIRDIWGYNYGEWAPLAVRLEVLYADLDHPDPTAFKERFPSPKQPGDFVHEFLYLNNGKRGWNWGMVGFVNGALLWPDALRYFIDQIGGLLRGKEDP